MEAIIDKFVQKIVKCKYNINDDDPLVTIALQKIYNKNQLDEFTKYEQIKRALSQHGGDMWQEILGTAHGWEDLGIGHETGCDLKNEKDKKIIEVKNKYNTLNSSSRAAVIQKLQTCVKDGYTCYIGIVNSRNQKSYNKKLDTGIYECGGGALFDLIFEKDNTIFKNVLDLIHEKFQLLHF